MLSVGLIVKRFFKIERNIFLFTFAIVATVSLTLILQDRYNVFLVYKYGSLDFWNNINPYSDWDHSLDRYLYGPLFSIVFIIFAVLPSWLGALFWNLGNFALFFFAVFKLPEKRFDDKKRRFIFWFLFPIVLTDLFYFQSNVLVASLFLIAFSLLERKKRLTAITVILVSGFAKIYGLIQLGTLIFYKRFWKNAIFAVSVSLIFFIAPLIKIPPEELFLYYKSWFNAIDLRHNPPDFEVIYRLLYQLGFHSIIKHITLVQGITLLIICISVLFQYKKFDGFNFRAQVFGIVISWVILFSTTAEKHTYIIAMVGLIIWFLAGPKTKFDSILLWLNFLIIILLPIDVIFPKPLMHLVYYKLALNLLLFTLTWIRMYTFTFFSKNLA